MCKVFEVSRSGYYKWKQNRSIKRIEVNELDEKIKIGFKANKSRYGSPRLAIYLATKGIFLSRATVGRKMKSLKLIARRKRRFKITTQSNHRYAIAPNLLNRVFDVDEPGTAWVR